MKLKLLGAMLLSASILCGSSAFAADPKPKEKAKPAAQDQKNKSVSEGELAQWLVDVVGLSILLPASPSEQECFAILLQNSITPKAGWNSTNVVTMGTLARVVVQSMHRQDEIQHPDDDAAWIAFLKTQGMDLASIGQAMDVLETLNPAYAGEAAVTSTDPLEKQARINPVGEQQLGTDLQQVTMPQIIKVYGLVPGAEPEPAPPAPQNPPKPQRPTPRPPTTRS